MDENQTTSDPTKKSRMNPFIPIVIVGLIVIITIGIFAFQGQTNSKPASNTNTEAAVQPTSENIVQSSYKDGTFEAVGDYISPGGGENIDVTLKLKAGIIEDAVVKSMAHRPNSVRYQEIFIDNYKQYIVGKNINDVKLDKVAGSSLTPEGFNDALDKIKAEAKA